MQVWAFYLSGIIGISRSMWKDNIKMDLKEYERRCKFDSNGSDGIQWRAFVMPSN